MEKKARSYKCAQCDGTEGIFRPVETHPANFRRFWLCSTECQDGFEVMLQLANKECPRCNGSGTIGPATCKTCEGLGLVKRGSL